MGNRKLPFGYQMRMGEIVRNEPEAKAVQDIFLQYTLGASLKEIAEQMSKTGPTYDEGKTVDTHVDMAIQVNGKLKGAVTVPAASGQETVMAAAMELDKVRKAAEGMTVVKTILVKDKLMNLIVKPAK